MKKRLLELVDRTLIAISRFMWPQFMRHWCYVLLKNPHISDSWGFHIRPIRYDEPLPDFRTLTTAVLERRRVPPEIDFALPSQMTLLETLAAESRAELDSIAQREEFDFSNDYFTALDACVYYALIRHLKPRRIIEVGSGYSTRIASLAVAKNEVEGIPGEIVCIEPYPDARLTKSSANFRLIEKPVEHVPLSTFEALEENDILMIDSSHVVKAAGDVCYEFLDILPRLRAGVWVHVHDIYFPQNYPPKWLIDQRKAYNEQYLLEALLSGSKAFAPKLANHWLVLDHRDAVNALCPPKATAGISIEQLGGSFWMCRN